MIKVLIAENEEIIRKSLVYTIDWFSMGCTVISDVENGEEGLKCILEENPDLIITDIRMPKLDGIEMLDIGSRTNSFESIIITGYEEFEYAKQAIGLNVIDYILKPIDEEKLCESVIRAKRKIYDKNLYKEIYEKAKEKRFIPISDMEIFIDSENIDKYVLESLKYIVENYNDKISIEDMAGKLDISTSYLSRRFKAETSQTFLEVLNKYRIKKAIEIMKDEGLRIYKISNLVGFSNYKHFCNVFRRYTNMAPSEFMKSKSYIFVKQNE